MNTKLCLYEELTLLAINDGDGSFSSGMYLYGIAGAALSELLLTQRLGVADDKEMIEVLERTTTSDVILDEIIGTIDQAKKPMQLKHWVGKVANMPKLKHRVAEQLCEKGILQQDEKKVLWMFSQKVYPEFDGRVEDAIRIRMANSMFDADVKPDPSTAVLIALAFHTGLLKPNFAPVELKQHDERIREIAQGKLLAVGATETAIQAVQTAIMLAAILPAITVATTASH